MNYGNYAGNINIISNEACNSPQILPVSLTMFAPILEVSEDSLVFSTVPGGTPGTQPLIVSNAFWGSFSYTVYENISWLSVDSDSGSVPPADTINVSIDTEGLNPGSYLGSIIIYASQTLGAPDTISILLNINEQLSGEISGFLPGDRVYSVIGNLEVPEGDYLEIAPGAVFNFTGNYRFDINGCLKAIGIEGDSIFFQPADTNIIWSGLKFPPMPFRPDSSLLRYCVITGSCSSGVKVNTNDLTIDKCWIRGNSNYRYGGGIYIPSWHNCKITESKITNNKVYGNNVNMMGGGICSTGDLIVSDCYIAENNISLYQTGFGGGVYSYGSSEISGCNIEGNQAKYGGGIYLGYDIANIEFCIIAGNTALIGGGIYSGVDSLFVRNCTFYHNMGTSGGAGINILKFVDFHNCVFNWNIGTNTIYVTSNEHDSFINYNDFYNNSALIFAGYVNSGLGVQTQTNANGDPCDIYNNIFLDPLFVDPQNGDFHLMQVSPAIDAGDPLSPFDPDSTIADIGAFYFDHNVGISNTKDTVIPSEFNFYPCYPNPFNPEITLQFDIPKDCNGSLKIYDVNGREIQDLGFGIWDLGTHRVVWDGGKQASGVYFVRLEAGDYVRTQKIILLK